MTPPVTIQGELRLPAAFLQGQDMDAIELRLLGYGLLPKGARERRWRMDAENPGGYVLLFTFALVPIEE
jgi:hypothetical protein